MANKLYEAWIGLPGWAKGVTAVGGMAIVYFTGRGFINRLKDKANQEKEKQTIAQAGRDLAGLKKSGVIPSYSPTQYKSWADGIEKQFSGCDWSEAVKPYLSGSGKYVYDIIGKMKNDADVLSLVQAFGVRTYDQCGISLGDGNITAGLSQAISDELYSYEIEKINGVLASKKINFRF